VKERFDKRVCVSVALHVLSATHIQCIKRRYIFTNVLVREKGNSKLDRETQRLVFIFRHPCEIAIQMPW